MRSTIPRSCLLLTALAGSGCLSFSFGDDQGDDNGDDATGETGDEGGDEPPGPATPSRTVQPLVDGALWSIRWDTTDPIEHVALGELGLALANGAHAALLDPDNGEPLWGIEPFNDTASALRLRADELIVGRRVTVSEDWIWELRHYSAAGSLTDTVAFDGYGPLVVDGGGRVFMIDDGPLTDQLAAFSGAGQPLWSHPLIEEHEINGLFAVEDGVVLVESTPWEDLELDYRLRHFDAAGELLLDTGYTHVLALVGDLALADARTYAAEEGVFGLPGRIHAVEPEFGGLAWTLEFGADAQVRIEPDGNGLIALIAEQDAPAQVSWIAEDGSVLESRDATTGPAVAPLLVVGAGGEVIAGGTVDGEMQLSRLE